MKTYEHEGWYGKGTVYVMEKMEDWDEYRKYLEENDLLQYDPNFDSFKEDFVKYIGKIWQDTDKIRYCYNGEPVYVEYKVIALEDDYANADWYWVVQNVDDDRDIQYLLANDTDFEKHIK